MKKLLFPTTVLAVGLSLALPVQAQLSPDEQEELDHVVREREAIAQERQQLSYDEQRERNKGWRERLIAAKTACLEGKEGSWDDYNTTRSQAVEYIGGRDVGRLEQFRIDFPYFIKCPPEKQSEKNKLNDDEIKAITARRADETSLVNILFSGGYATVQPPQAGYGVEIVPGAEKFVAKTDSSLTGYKLEARFIPKDKRWMFGVEYSDVDGSSEGQIANGTENVGIVYHDFAPSGSTGVAIGPRGLDVNTATEHHYLEMEAFLKDVFIGFRLFDIGLGVRLSDTEHQAMVTTPTFTDIRSDSTQQLYDRQIFVIGEAEIDLSDNSLGIKLTPRVEAGFRNANLESMQHNICGLCAAADQDFTIRIDDKDSGFYFGAGIDAEVKTQLSENASFGIRGSASWQNSTGHIINTETGDDLFIRNTPTHLSTDETYRAGIDAFIRASF